MCVKSIRRATSEARISRLLTCFVRAPGALSLSARVVLVPGGLAGTGCSVVVDAVEHLVRGIVDNPDDVRVDMVTSRRGRTVEVHVHPDDLGKVIGRGGRTATALRTLVAGIGGRGIRVDVVDTDQ